MTDQELADTLKARLSAWQGYMEQAQRHAPGKPAEEPPVEQNTASETPVFAEVAFPSIAEPVPDSLIERYEEQIADLRAALEHERRQSRCLSETLAREQALRATASTNPPRSGGDRQHERYSRAESEMRSQILWLFILLVGIVCCLVFFIR
ncbi:MAG TPA: hypothetical protein VFA07_02465 [Chthonomonadaceae bacterium]|nr:hypothetical protein [Chthonomonadaceae bacterium]